MTSNIRIHESHEDGLPVVVGCPFQTGPEGFKGNHAELTLPGGRVIPADGVPLNEPDQHGVQWIELSFMSFGGGDAAVRLVDESSEGGLLLEEAGVVMLTNETLRISLNKDQALPPVVVERCSNKGWVETGHLCPEVVTKGETHRPSKSERQVKILRNGAARSQVELTGQLAPSKGAPSLTYRITVEVWSKGSSFRLDWMLMHLIPGVPEFDVDRATLEGNWQVGESPVRSFRQHNFGPYYKRRIVRNPSPVALVSDFKSARVCVEDPAMLLDDTDYAHYLKPPTVDTEGWLALKGSEACICISLVDFAETRPNRISSEGDRLSYDMIPSGHTTRWQQGRRKEQTLLIGISDAGNNIPDHDLASVLSRPNAYARAQPAIQTLKAHNCFDLNVALNHEPGRNIRFSAFLNSTCQLNTPADKWNLGDTVDNHYTRGYAGIPNRFELKPGAPQMPTQFSAGGALFPPEMVLFQEPVWTNNEYDIIHTLTQEICRRGTNDHLTTLRWFARHNIEVDFLAYNDDPFHHRATPAHSEHHNTTGAYPSHFWSQGLLQYYLLTGDRDALEVAIALGDKTIECLNHPEAGTHSFDREFGWGLLSLVCLVEVTGLERFRNASDDAADFLQAFDRAAHTGAVNLSSGNASHSLERQMIEGAFGYASLVEGMDRYQKVTGRQDTEEWLRILLNQLLNATWEKIDEGSIPGGLVLQILAIGYERTGHSDFLKTALISLEHTDRSGGFHASTGETKANASTYRSYHRILGHLDRAGMLDKFELETILARRT
ncbi:MAG: hypothetical protein O3B01_30085 [Planctomycetota bacterium]|nr:hypothetical protein [Planctomycetota bacterium]